jgi:uncharacterized protein YfbU (UPF0304 family)
MELKRSERWILSCQYRILEGLYPEEASEFRKVREALDRGDVALIAAFAPFSDHNESLEPDLSEDDRAQVRRILSLFDALQHSHRELEEPTAIDDPEELLFRGFHAENESTLGEYASRLLAETGEFAHVDHKASFESDGPLLPGYQRMLDAWRTYSEKRDLTTVQIYFILEAATGPTHD